MADNITLNAGSGGDVTGADEISSVKYPRVKLIHGAENTNDGDICSANPLPVRLVPWGYFGMTVYKSLDLDEGSLEQIKGAAGTLYGMWVTNTATATRWIKFYNATSGTVGTGTPVITIGIPGNSTDDISGSFGPGGSGIAFATGICVGASTAAADNDTGAPGTGDLICNFFFT